MVITVGKAPDNDFVIDDLHVSRHHARLTREAEGYWLLEDLDSSNGTFVNGAQIAKKRVTLADKIQFGNAQEVTIPKLLKSKNIYSNEFLALKKVY